MCLIWIKRCLSLHGRRHRAQNRRLMAHISYLRLINGKKTHTHTKDDTVTSWSMYSRTPRRKTLHVPLTGPNEREKKQIIWWTSALCNAHPISVCLLCALRTNSLSHFLHLLFVASKSQMSDSYIDDLLSLLTFLLRCSWRSWTLRPPNFPPPTLLCDVYLPLPLSSSSSSHPLTVTVIPGKKQTGLAG